VGAVQRLPTPVGAVQRLPTPVDAVRCRRIRAAVVRAMPHAVAAAVRVMPHAAAAVAAMPQAVVRHTPVAAAAAAVRAGTDAPASRLILRSIASRASCARRRCNR